MGLDRVVVKVRGVGRVGMGRAARGIRGRHLLGTRTVQQVEIANAERQ